jgi:hypothetical protein
MPCRPLALCLALAAAACSSSGDPSVSTPAPSPTPSGPPTMTITESGVSPQVLHSFDSRETITFVNGDVRPHDMRSDPHPAHTDCAAMSVGPMMPGESRQIAGPSLPPFSLCYYHDETDPGDDRFRGLVVTH